MQTGRASGATESFFLLPCKVDCVGVTMLLSGPKKKNNKNGWQ
jgi:hypothetical protein